MMITDVMSWSMTDIYDDDDDDDMDHFIIDPHTHIVQYGIEFHSF